MMMMGGDFLFCRVQKDYESTRLDEWADRLGESFCVFGWSAIAAETGYTPFFTTTLCKFVLAE